MIKNLNIVKNFVAYCKKELHIQTLPHIVLTKDPSFVVDNRSFGGYVPDTNTIRVFIGNRNTADYLRTLAHELTHHRQRELNMLHDDSGITGSEMENDANAMAGILLRDYGQENVEIYDLDSTF